MKKNEIIELNGQEYTLELNRETLAQIDQLCNIEKSLGIINRNFYEYLDDKELSDDFDPTKLVDLDDEKIQEEINLKEQTMHKLIERSFYLWLYPNHKLTITQVKELLKSYYEDEEKAEWLGNKVIECLNKCKEIRDTYLEEQKNLKALANNKKN